jgi:hypothetical protein
MPQKTNLNVSPYFDDFDPNKSYHKVLFKPGYPVQARELTTLQTILQNQIELFGSHVFKEGSAVIPGNISYRNDLNAVILEDTYNGYSPEVYLPYLTKKQIKGEVSGVTAVINSYISRSTSEINKTTIYVSYLNSDSNTNSQSKFLDGEKIVMNEDAALGDEFENLGITLKAGEGIGITISENATAIGSGVFIEEGVYFIRGYFVNAFKDILYLDQYSNRPSYKIGFKIFEDIKNSYEDSSLNDNAQGFSNYAAPGADRFSLFIQLSKIPIESTDVENFVQLLEVREGRLISINNTPEYNILSQEFARRTYDESGDYFVNAPNIVAKETLNNFKGNEGIFLENELTYNGNVPNESTGTYKISPLKAYIRGYEVETISPVFLDFPKPRTAKTLENESINYFTGPTFTLNRVYGSPVIGLSTTYTVSLRDSRVGSSQTTAPGNEIGLARVYDFALESGSYNTTNLNQNQWDITLFDIQTYTIIELNEPITLSVPTQIKGSQSGAIAYLRNSVTNSGNIIVYSSQGNFSIGEKLSFNGIENSRITTKVRPYTTGDIKSLYGIVGSAYTFTADTVQSPITTIGQVTITPGSSGISTVISTNVNFVGVASTGNLVSFSNPGVTTTTYAKVEGVSLNSITISGVTTVSGICDGALPSSTINPSDFKILTTNLQSSTDNALYTELPKRNISSVDLTNSYLTIRKQFDVTITSNSTGSIDSNSENETFLPFDEERYVLIRQDGTTEPLSSDKFVFTNGSKTLTINGLGSNGSAKLIATLRKINVKSKIKNRNRIKTLIVDKSKYSASGIGSTTLNDGLSYGNYPYGTRVQDEEICLLEPDVTKIYGIFESNDTNSPDLPNLVITNLNGPTNKVGDLLIGEEFVGKSSQTIGIYVEKINDLQLSFNYLNSNSFIEGEEVLFKESGIVGNISSVNSGDNNITSSFILNSNQNNTIYDYSKLIRNKTTKEPTRKLKIVFESAGFSSSDTGDLVTANSYQQFDYCDIGKINEIRNSDILDIRPRVATSTISEGSRSPFEFLGRTFVSSDNLYTNILASDESILLSYSFYLSRIDKIFLTKNGIFQLSSGVPSETPQEPTSRDDALEIATVLLPPYLCDVNDSSVILTKHKRYQMYDISKLEDRIKNLEYYTSLSLLESDTSNLFVTDSNGLNRFKSGFFVDDFSSTNTQQKLTIVKNSIDVQKSELRPTHYTTSIDLLLGTNSLVGIGTSVNSLADARTDTNLIGTGIKRTGQLITLDYEEESYIQQPFSTRVVNVNPYVSDYFGGTVELFPSSDVWVDQVQVAAKTINAEGNYNETRSQLISRGFDAQSGYSPVTWGSWETTWTGSTSSSSTRDVTQGYNIVREQLQTITKTGTSTRSGTRQLLKEEFAKTSFGNQVLSSEIIPYVRSRNIEFSGRRLKPFTRVYCFFDGINVTNFAIPKLLEITMRQGVFQVGETVIGSFDNSSGNSPQITFRVAQQNHKYGTYNNPSDIFTINPYAQETTAVIPTTYSSTSTILNIDTFSLSNTVQGQFSGYIAPLMKLKGQTSGAEATVMDLRLITDNLGEIIGSFFIPNGNIDVNPRFQAGTKLFRITSSSSNSQLIGETITSAEEKYFVDGKINTVQENVILVRNARVESQTTSESKTVSEIGSPTVVGSSVIGSVYVPPASSYSSGGGGGGERTYQGFAAGYAPSTGASGIVNQNAGGSQSQAFGGGTGAVIGAAAVQRAIADGYSISSIQSWVNRTGATVGSAAQALGIKPKS